MFRESECERVSVLCESACFFVSVSPYMMYNESVCL